LSDRLSDEVRGEFRRCVRAVIVGRFGGSQVGIGQSFFGRTNVGRFHSESVLQGPFQALATFAIRHSRRLSAWRVRKRTAFAANLRREGGSRPYPGLPFSPPLCCGEHAS